MWGGVCVVGRVTHLQKYSSHWMHFTAASWSSHSTHIVGGEPPVGLAGSEAGIAVTDSTSVGEVESVPRDVLGRDVPGTSCFAPFPDA